MDDRNKSFLTVLCAGILIAFLILFGMVVSRAAIQSQKFSTKVIPEVGDSGTTWATNLSEYLKSLDAWLLAPDISGATVNSANMTYINVVTAIIGTGTITSGSASTFNIGSATLGTTTINRTITLGGNQISGLGATFVKSAYFQTTFPGPGPNDGKWITNIRGFQAKNSSSSHSLGFVTKYPGYHKYDVLSVNSYETIWMGSFYDGDSDGQYDNWSVIQPYAWGTDGYDGIHLDTSEYLWIDADLGIKITDPIITTNGMTPSIKATDWPYNDDGFLNLIVPTMSGVDHTSKWVIGEQINGYPFDLWITYNPSDPLRNAGCPARYVIDPGGGHPSYFGSFIAILDAQNVDIGSNGYTGTVNIYGSSGIYFYGSMKPGWSDSPTEKPMVAWNGLYFYPTICPNTFTTIDVSSTASFAGTAEIDSSGYPELYSASGALFNTSVKNAHATSSTFSLVKFATAYTGHSATGYVTADATNSLIRIGTNGEGLYFLAYNAALTNTKNSSNDMVMSAFIGSTETHIRDTRTFANNSDLGRLGASSIIRVPANTNLYVKVKSSYTVSIAVRRSSFSVHRIGK